MAKAPRIKTGPLSLRRKETNVLTAFRWKGGTLEGLPNWLRLQELKLDRKKGVLVIVQRIGATLHVQPGDILVAENNKIHAYDEEFVLTHFELVADAPEAP